MKELASAIITKVVEPLVVRPLSLVVDRFAWGGRALIPAWVIIVAVVAWLLDGPSAWTSPWAWSAAALGAVTIGTGLIVQSRRAPKPLVLVARFRTTSESLQDQANSLRERVRERLARSGVVRVGDLDEAIDVTSADQCERAVAMGRERRCGAIVVGSLRADEELGCTTAVLPVARSLGGWTLPGEGASDTRTIPVSAASSDLIAYRNAAADDLAQLAQLTLAVALIHSGQAAPAKAILLRLDPPTYDSLFFAAFASLLMAEYDDAAQLAERALAKERRPPTIGIAIYAYVELGDRPAARRWYEQVPKTALAEQLAALDHTSTAALLPMAVTRLLADNVAALADIFERGRLEFERIECRSQAREQYQQGHGRRARELVERMLVGPLEAELEDLALYAASLALEEHPDARAVTEAVADRIAVEPPVADGSIQPWKQIAEAFALLGDAAAAVPRLEALLERCPPGWERDALMSERLDQIAESPEFAELLARYHINWDLLCLMRVGEEGIDEYLAKQTRPPQGAA